MPALKFPFKTVFVSLILVGALGGLVVLLALPSRKNQIPTVTIAGKSYSIKIADTPEKRATGLMNVNNLPKSQGMLFIFDAPGLYDFWNKDTLIPLDLIYARDGIIVDIGSLPKITEGETPKTYYAKKLADSVIELNAGQVKANLFEIGDEIRISR